MSSLAHPLSRPMIETLRHMAASSDGSLYRDPGARYTTRSMAMNPMPSGIPRPDWYVRWPVVDALLCRKLVERYGFTDPPIYRLTRAGNQVIEELFPGLSSNAPPRQT